jgi:hypothetical protein
MPESNREIWRLRKLILKNWRLRKPKLKRLLAILKTFLTNWLNLGKEKKNLAGSKEYKNKQGYR